MKKYIYRNIERQSMALSMDEYIEQLLAEFNGPPALRKIIRNILDEPIPAGNQTTLVEPASPEAYAPSAKTKRCKTKSPSGRV